MWLARETDETLLLILDDAEPERKYYDDYGSWTCSDCIVFDPFDSDNHFNDITWEDGLVEIVMKKRQKKI